MNEINIYNKALTLFVFGLSIISKESELVAILFSVSVTSKTNNSCLRTKIPGWGQTSITKLRRFKCSVFWFYFHLGARGSQMQINRLKKRQHAAAGAVLGVDLECENLKKCCSRIRAKRGAGRLNSSAHQASIISNNNN